MRFNSLSTARIAHETPIFNRIRRACHKLVGAPKELAQTPMRAFAIENDAKIRRAYLNRQGIPNALYAQGGRYDMPRIITKRHHWYVRYRKGMGALSQQPHSRPGPLSLYL